MTIEEQISAVHRVLRDRIFRVRNEAELQDQVSLVLNSAGIEHQREVTDGAGRYDVMCGRLILELKLKASVAAVERQAMRYARMADVDAVCVVTTSSRLAAQLRAHGDILGGKPFRVLAVRTS